MFVTGATGLVGSHVAEQLRRRGDRVVALVRESSDTAFLQSIGCELATGDVGDPVDALAERMLGCDAVVHAAAKVFQAGSRKAYLRVNVEGTESVLRAAGRVVPRVVHVSSVAVYAGLSMDRPLTEERWAEADPARQHAYAASKHLSERVAWRLHDDGAIRLTTVRPSVVYGERDRSAARVFIPYFSRAVVPLVGGGRTTLPVVYAGNVARGILGALDREQAVGRSYNLGRDIPISGRRLAELVAREVGRSPRFLPVPGAPLRMAAAAVDVLARITPLVRRRDLRRAVRSLSRDNPYDSTRARLELGWARHISHEEGVRRTVEWWLRRG